MTVYTHTLRETVLRSLTAIKDAGIHFNVLVTESQPNCDGRVTAKQLVKMGIEVKIGIDAGNGEIFIPSRFDAVRSGSDNLPEFRCM
jgi:translation initiation factor 2B subunit (eIF-2B alpha/beta/delta family)